MPDEPDTKLTKETQTCVHCGAENPPGLLLCLTCGREPITGRDLFALSDIPIPDQPLAPSLTTPSFDLVVTLPDPIQVPDPLPIPTLEDFAAPPPQPHPMPAAVYRSPPHPPKDMVPVLSPLPRRIIGLIGLAVVALLGLGTVGNFAALNLPGGICLGSVWLVTTIAWLALVLARRGESRSQATSARRRLVKALGQRLFEITPGPAREQRAQLPVIHIPPLTRAASELIYLSSAGTHTQQLTQLLLGTLCALGASNHLELATQTYDVLTASPLRHRVETIKKTVVSRRALYTGAGYLEKLILEHLRRSPTGSARDLATGVLRQAGADLLDRINAEIAELPSPQEGEASDLDAQVAAMREFCDQLKALNPDLYEQITQEVEGAAREFTQAARQRSR